MDLLNKNSICYCAGVGEDISFDLELIKRFSCKVFAFDPTPRAIKYVQNIKNKNLNFMFCEIGLWSHESYLKFYAPENPSFVSHSVYNRNNSSSFFIAKFKSISQIMKEFSHEHIDLLKLDIEGAEYEVLNSITEEMIDIDIICVEFHQPRPIKEVLKLLYKLISLNYDLIFIDGYSNYTFLGSENK